MDPVTTYEDLKALMARSYPDMSKQLQRIARFAMEQPNELALGTVGQFWRPASRPIPRISS